MNWIAEHWHTVTAVIIAGYEAVVRIIPTVGNYSVIAKVIQILSFLSSALNREKK